MIANITNPLDRLHLGCGKIYLPGFFHVDLAAWPHVDHVGTMADLAFIKSGTVDLIYCCHAFGFLDRHQAKRALQEWHRVLRPGGTLRLALPSFDALIDVYLKTGDLNRILGPLFGRWRPCHGDNGTSDDDPEMIYHKTIYNETSIAELLLGAGFAHTRPWDWRQVDHGRIDDYSQAYFPHMDKVDGMCISLNIEVDKPSLL